MKKALIGLSVALNVLTLGALLIAMLGGGKLLAEKFLKPGHERWVSQFEILGVQSRDVVLLGDSITAGGAWQEWFPGMPVINRGISGDTTAGVLARLYQVTDGKPAKVFLLIGTNDLAMGISVTDIANNVQSIVEAIQSSSPQTQVYVQSVMPRAADYREDIEALNKAVKTRLSGKAEWVDLYPLLIDSDDGSIRNDMSNDELHLLGEGYRVWRDTIGPLM